eukprot:RCo047772
MRFRGLRFVGLGLAVALLLGNAAEANLLHASPCVPDFPDCNAACELVGGHCVSCPEPGEGWTCPVNPSPPLAAVGKAAAPPPPALCYDDRVYCSAGCWYRGRHDECQRCPKEKGKGWICPQPVESPSAERVNAASAVPQGSPCIEDATICNVACNLFGGSCVRCTEPEVGWSCPVNPSAASTAVGKVAAPPPPA